MGRRGKKHNPMYITTTEHKEHFGGAKPELEKRVFRRPPFNHCRLTLQPATKPCSDREGNVFDYQPLIAFLSRHGGKHPLTGKSLKLSDIFLLNIQKNENGNFHCPISFKVLTDYVKVVAIRNTGNVYAYSTIEIMNIKTNQLKDLISGNDFTMEDLVIIQDPEKLYHTDIDNSWFHKNEIKNSNDDEMSRDIGYDTTTSRVMKKLTEMKKDNKNNNLGQIQRIIAPERTKTMSASFTSTSLTTRLSRPKNSESETTVEKLREQMYERIRKKKKVSYCTVHTSYGDILIKLLCRFAPMTCHNFITLAEKGYYNNTIFHRLVKGFAIQGGDPTATGEGGESIFGHPFKDEINPILKHEDRVGVVGMAKRVEKNTNTSQFYITLSKGTSNLNGKHTIFGHVEKGFDTLQKFQSVRMREDNSGRPALDIALTGITVSGNPFKEDWEEQKLHMVEKKRTNDFFEKKKTKKKNKKASSSSSSVGKYLNIQALQNKRKKKKRKKKRKRNENEYDTEESNRAKKKRRVE